MPRYASTIAANLLLAGVYFCIGKFGLKLAFLHTSASPVWPPTGLALAALLLWGYRLWPGVFAGALLVNLTTLGTSVVADTGIAVGNTLEALLGAWFTHRFANGPRAFERAQDILRFVALAAIPSTALSATFGVTSLCVDGAAPWPQYLAIWVTWWLGDFVSDIVVAPFLLLWIGWRARDRTIDVKRAIEGVGLLLSIFAAGLIVFLAPMIFGKSYPFAYLAIPPLLWAGYRFGPRGAAACALIMSSVALWGTLRGFGPFARPDPNLSLLFLQAFMATVTLTALVVAALVTESKRAAQAMGESEARFRLLADSAPVLIWVNDRQGCQFVNRAYTEFFGSPMDDLLGFGWAKFVHPDDYNRYVEGYKRAAAALVPFRGEVRCRRADGEYRWLLSTGLPRFLPSGEFAGYVGSSTDITEIVQARETLARSRKELEDLVLERTAKLRESIAELEAFSYSLSHDMRAPIRAIQGFSQIALTEFGEKVGPPATDYLKKVISAATRMDRLIQDVLTLSRLSRQEITLASIDVEKLIRDIISERPELQPPRADIEIVSPLPSMRGHMASLTQCVTNLLDNAVKFVSRGVKPRVRVYSELVQQHVRLWIEDNGIGIPPEAQRQLFQMFSRLHSERDYAGTGIGLAIVRKAAERMGGQTGVESEPGRGSRFWLQLPRGE
ncbi:MAG: MASE1 domain-containing protein [Verrucomicrobia subdivision 3 bacterium]|nr:MASE1 domain-containing protein [Limisphaerales bacterium]